MPGGAASGLVPAAVAWPLLAALLLALPVPRLGAVAAGRVGLAASLVTLALAGLDLTSLPGGGWLADRLALSLELLVALPGALAGLLALAGSGGPGEAWPARGERTRWMAIQLATGGAVAACRADALSLLLAGLAAMLAGAVLLLPRRTGPALPFAGLLLVAWLGAAWMSAASGVPARWSGLAPVVRPGAALQGGVGLLLLPMLLLAWLGPACSLDAPARDRAPLLPLLAVPALGAALRLRGLLPQAVGPVLCVAGVLALLLVCLLAVGRRGLADRVVLAAALQLGMVAIGFGVGGTGGVVAGIMILGALVLLLPVALLPATGRGWRVAVLALAALPPFGLFAADFVLLLRLFAVTPLLGLLVLAGVGACGVSLLQALRREPILAETGREPILAEGREPIVAERGRESILAGKGREPGLAETGREPVMAGTRREPILARTRREPILGGAGREPSSGASRRDASSGGRRDASAGMRGGSGRVVGIVARQAPALVLLALLAWLGVAMPAALSDWLLGLSESAAGPAAPVATVPR